MSPTLLPDLESSEAIDAALGGLEDLRAYFVAQVRRNIPLALSQASQVSERWARCVQAVAKGRTEEVHALREPLQHSVQARLALLREASRLAGIASELGETELTGAPQISEAVARLETLQREVFARWQTADDLEELAVAWYPLPAARLSRIGQQHPAPQAWYDEQGKPF